MEIPLLTDDVERYEEKEKSKMRSLIATKIKAMADGMALLEARVKEIQGNAPSYEKDTKHVTCNVGLFCEEYKKYNDGSIHYYKVNKSDRSSVIKEGDIMLELYQEWPKTSPSEIDTYDYLVFDERGKLKERHTKYPTGDLEYTTFNTDAPSSTPENSKMVSRYWKSNTFHYGYHEYENGIQRF